MSTEEGKGEGQRRTITLSWKEGRNGRKEKRYRDTTLYYIHPANTHPGRPQAPCRAVEDME